MLGWYPVAARADGDPASDVLTSQTLYLPQDAGVPATQQAELGAELTAARRSHYQIRVAIIASAADLGSVTELWREPENYARFLGAELSLVYRGPLLVVMPSGLGTYRLGPATAADQTALTDVRAGGLGAIALAAIRHLATASGHALPLPSAAPASKRGENHTVAETIFAIGIALIALAWAASLRARPPRLRRRDVAST
jgi:hypothetical protein